MNDYILVTGAGGFIGFHLCKKLIETNHKVIGIDNLNSYYEKELKNSRLEILKNLSSEKGKNWNFKKIDLIDKENLKEIFEIYSPNIVVNLAAQAGVRYSLENPSQYINSNIVGFANLLEYCRIFKTKNLLYASSSSVYGGNKKVPFSELDPVNHPISLYAATKRSNELMAHSYSHLFNIPSTGMRFFTVYGPWGRPDMAPMIFLNSIINRKPIKIFNYGKMSRSFTYIDDVIEIICRLINKPARPDKVFSNYEPKASTSWCPFNIVNIGNKNSIDLLKFISYLEKGIGITAIKDFQDLQKGDVEDTLSDDKILKNYIGKIEYTSIEDGIRNLITWYKSFYKC